MFVKILKKTFSLVVTTFLDFVISLIGLLWLLIYKITVR